MQQIYNNRRTYIFYICIKCTGCTPMKQTIQTLSLWSLRVSSKKCEKKRKINYENFLRHWNVESDEFSTLLLTSSITLWQLKYKNIFPFSNTHTHSPCSSARRSILSIHTNTLYIYITKLCTKSSRLKMWLSVQRTQLAETRFFPNGQITQYKLIK